MHKYIIVEHWENTPNIKETENYLQTIPGNKYYYHFGVFFS